MSNKKLYTSNKDIATRNKGIVTSSKKLLVADFYQTQKACAVAVLRRAGRTAREASVGRIARVTRSGGVE